MKIAIASGKGGTGKTTFAVACTLAANNNVKLVDCDVEEPNCHLFLKDDSFITIRSVENLIPDIDESKCLKCGKCAEFCQFNAIISVTDSFPMIFPEMCHACGGCAEICTSNAIIEIPNKIGTVTSKVISKNMELVTGQLDIGHAMAPPVIKDVLKEVKESDELVIIDSPPGTSCPFVTTVKESDFVIFVTEPTPFGLNDLKIAIETITHIGIPYAVIINRSEDYENIITEYCHNENIDILLQIENSRKVAEVYSHGGTILDALPDLKEKISFMLKNVESRLKTNE